MSHFMLFKAIDIHLFFPFINYRLVKMIRIHKYLLFLHLSIRFVCHPQPACPFTCNPEGAGVMVTPREVPFSQNKTNGGNALVLAFSTHWLSITKAQNVKE